MIPWAFFFGLFLGFGVSEKPLARWRDSGLLKAGKHWRRKFLTGNSPVLYHLRLGEEAMGEASARGRERGCGHVVLGAVSHDLRRALLWQVEILITQKLNLARRAATVSEAKLALPGSITCKSAVRMNQGVTAKL